MGTIACDGWTNAANESIWDFLIHTPDHKEYLWCKNLSEESHTGIFLAKELEEIIKQIGPEKFFCRGIKHPKCSQDNY